MPSDKDGLAELVRELGLTSAPSDLDTLRSEVKARISELHPDHKTVDSTVRLQLLRKVLKKTGKGSTALQTIDPSFSVVKAEPVAFAPMDTIDAKLSAIEGAKHIASSRAFLFPKISLATLTAALAWVFLFPRTFADHPFVGSLLKSSYACVIWFGAILLLAAAWLLVWWLERAKEQRVAELLSLTYQRTVLETTGRSHPEGFSSSHFQDQLYPKHVWYPNWIRRLSKIMPGRGLYYRTPLTYDAPMAEKVTQLALDRFVHKGWIVRTQRPEGESSIDDWYRIV